MFVYNHHLIRNTVFLCFPIRNCLLLVSFFKAPRENFGLNRFGSVHKQLVFQNAFRTFIRIGI